MSKGGERKIVDDKDLSVAFFERLIDKKMFLYVDVEDQIGSAVPLMSEDAMYEFLGLRAEDERAKKASFDAENENETNAGPMDLEGAELPVDDCIPGEDSIFYDKENPPMKVGTIYASMIEFMSSDQL